MRRATQDITKNQDTTKNGFGIMLAGMVVCCAVMLIPVVGYFAVGGTIAGLTSNFGVFAPIALCIGVHVAMFAFMGKSCHGSAKKDVEDLGSVEAVPSRVPRTHSRA